MRACCLLVLLASTVLACPEWCQTWMCDGSSWCADGSKPAPCSACSGLTAPRKSGTAGMHAGVAVGPVAPGASGWVVEHAKHARPVASDGSLRVTGDTRAYLTNNPVGIMWPSHSYVRFDLNQEPLVFEVDLSQVPCGCLACVYLVAMKDPNEFGSNYCDMAENVAPGLHDGTCYELDIFEANNNAMQSAVHTQFGGTYGSGNCDRNGCFMRTGGPQATPERQGLYGLGKYIDSSKPFTVKTKVGGDGALTITLSQDGKTAKSFTSDFAGNPQGRGVPGSARAALQTTGGKLALVSSLWTDADLSWLDGPACNQCDISTASYSIKITSPLSTASDDAAAPHGATTPQFVGGVPGPMASVGKTPPISASERLSERMSPSSEDTMFIG